MRRRAATSTLPVGLDTGAAVGASTFSSFATTFSAGFSTTLSLTGSALATGAGSLLLIGVSVAAFSNRSIRAKTAESSLAGSKIRPHISSSNKRGGVAPRI